MSHDAELRASLARVVAQFPSLPIEALAHYVGDILRWNDEIGLVSKKEPLAACERLLIESAEFGAVVAATVTPGETRVRVADVGSGAGFPGIVWRWLYPQWDLVLVERRDRKAAFIEHLVPHLRLRDIEVVAADARELSRRDSYRASFDVVATMAVGEPTRTAPQIEELLTSNGIFATTIALDADVPARCGAGLALENDTRAQFGRYATYRNRV
jgi:16S rRNA (guanine527-N7)-methyltransferase